MLDCVLLDMDIACGGIIRREADLLTEAVDLQHEEAVQQLLVSYSFDLKTIQQTLYLALASGNLKIIASILRASSMSRSLISSLFTEYASEGLQPEIIFLLQEFLSPAELAYHFRQRMKFRHGDGCFPSFYIVDPLEPLHLNEMKQKIQKSVPPTISLSLSLSTSLSLDISLSLSLSLLSLSLSVCLCLSLCVCLSVSLSLSLDISLHL
jgi:hypothetical protein